MYSFEIIPNLKEILTKLSKKNKPLYDQVIKKIEEIISNEDIEHYKNLRNNLKNKKRVHIGHFVLIFSYSKQEEKIRFLDFDHHDNIYKK